MKGSSNSDLATAKKILRNRGISNNVISPARLLSLSTTMQKSLYETLNLIAYLKMQGHGYSPFPLTSKVLTGEYI